MVLRDRALIERIDFPIGLSQQTAFELRRRQVAGCGMETLLVVDFFQEDSDARLGVGQIAILGAVHLFVLQSFDE